MTGDGLVVDRGLMREDAHALQPLGGRMLGTATWWLGVVGERATAATTRW